MPGTTGEDRLAVIHQELTGAVEGMLASDGWRSALAAAARFHRYSFDNLLLIYVQHAAALRQWPRVSRGSIVVAGYRQWGAMSRHVPAGRHGYKILRPNRLQWREAKDPGSGSWRRMGRFECAAPGVVIRSRSRLDPRKPLDLATVFDISRTDRHRPRNRPGRSCWPVGHCRVSARHLGQNSLIKLASGL